MAEKQILIICGEASGDLHAGNLAKKILEINPGIRISGVGGAILRQAAGELYYDIKDLSVLGFFDVIKKLPKFIRLKQLILKKIQEEKPAAVIFVDFSGFNLRLAKAIDNSVPTIYYISPQVWASRRGRIKTIKKYILKMIVLFKFEEEFYKKEGIDVDFVGHPLLDISGPSMDKEEFRRKLGFSESKTTIALLPGSRKQEIKHILPVMLGAVNLMHKKNPDIQLVVAKSTQVDWDIYKRIAGNSKAGLKIIEGQTYDCLNIADFCLVASGTATLETAIMQKPFAVIYKLGLLNYLLYRPQIKIPYIGMVNIVAGKMIVPEFIQFRATARTIAAAVLEILNDPSRIKEIKEQLSSVKSSLGAKGASLSAARIIVDFLNR